MDNLLESIKDTHQVYTSLLADLCTRISSVEGLPTDEKIDLMLSAHKLLADAKCQSYDLENLEEQLGDLVQSESELEEWSEEVDEDPVLEVAPKKKRKVTTKSAKPKKKRKLKVTKSAAKKQLQTRLHRLRL